LKFIDAMKSEDKERWEKPLDLNLSEWKGRIPIKIDRLPENSKILNRTWAMKKKANCQFWDGITARGFL
jgi:hypothetical protein